MGNIKYSDYKTSNGLITASAVNFDKTYEYLRLQVVEGKAKLYLNNNTDYIYIIAAGICEIADFAVNSIKVEDDSSNCLKFQYFVAR